LKRRSAVTIIDSLKIIGIFAIVTTLMVVVALALSSSRLVEVNRATKSQPSCPSRTVGPKITYGPACN
jgi:hypothetical protein